MKLRILSIFAVFGCATAALAQTIAWTVRHEGTYPNWVGILHTVDLTTGQMTRVGSLRTEFYSGGLAYDWVRGKLYGIAWRTGQFYEIDTTTGLGTTLNQFDWEKFTSLAYDPVTDKLFAGTDYGEFYRIDQDTATATLVSGSTKNLKGLAYDTARGSLVGSDGQGRFYTVDRDTGSMTLLSDGTGELFTHGLEYAPGLDRYFAIGFSTNELWSYDPTTFSRTLVAYTTAYFDGLAVVPEPATLVGLGLGALALAARRRRR